MKAASQSWGWEGGTGRRGKEGGAGEGGEGRSPGEGGREGWELLTWCDCQWCLRCCLRVKAASQSWHLCGRIPVWSLAWRRKSPKNKRECVRSHGDFMRINDILWESVRSYENNTQALVHRNNLRFITSVNVMNICYTQKWLGVYLWVKNA